MIGIGIFLLFTGGGLTVAFASTSISDVLSTWLSNKTDQSIREIDIEIQAEQEKQTERLKATLEAEINQLETEIALFLEEEKSRRVKEIKHYAEERIAEIPGIVEERANKEEIAAELDAILQKAMEEMEQVSITSEAQ